MREGAGGRGGDGGGGRRKEKGKGEGMAEVATAEEERGKRKGEEGRGRKEEEGGRGGGSGDGSTLGSRLAFAQVARWVVLFFVLGELELEINLGNGKRNQGKTWYCFTTVQANTIPFAILQNRGHGAKELLQNLREKGLGRRYMCSVHGMSHNAVLLCVLHMRKAAAPTCAEPASAIPTVLISTRRHIQKGQVKGWTVVDSAREHLNAKKRSCMQDNCSYIGTYKELRKHVRAEHPSAKPREVDPTLEQKWRRLEREREREDVMGTIRSSMPGAVFFGDYVIEGSQHGIDSDNEDGFDADAMGRSEGIEVGVDRNLMSVFLFLQAFGSAGNGGPNRGIRRHDRGSSQTLDRGLMRLSRESTVGSFDFSDEDSNNDDDDNVDGSNYGTSLAGRLRRQGRVLLGRSGRRRRRRQANGERR
ncbi:hypothetical protein Sango_0512500 [Sesamum angolense]|uniref:Uncharacterized protein n=1 Tax=Sesamum angolense TaxID=2727404 RepID=A0AAE1X4E0_9LAMI|nr:hypothetical protein Sango_0512500 [Sesamum angolense]